MFQSKAYKQFLALFLSLVIVGGGTIAYLLFNKSTLGVTPVKDGEVSNELTEKTNIAVANLKNTLNTAKPEKFIFEEISLDDLQVFPNSWVARNFKANQFENKLISGAEADPDKDGLSNRQEFLYGANPLNPSTYCGVETQTTDPKCPINDKQIIDAGFNPLTALPLEIKKKFKVKKIDKNIAENVETSFNVASDQGFDFPKLYEESRKLNLNDEFVKVKVLTQEDTGEGVLNYYKTRLDILKDFAQEDELSSFSNLYGVLETDKLEALRARYQDILDKLNGTITPNLMADYHRANILVVQKLIAVIQNRITLLSSTKIEVKEDMNVSQVLAKEMLWSYRNLNEQQSKLQARIERDYPNTSSAQ
jgi:hypothetical protein